jgi:hypothetical protein
MVGGSLWVLQLLPSLNMAEILLKVALKHQKSNQNQPNHLNVYGNKETKGPKHKYTIYVNCR